MVELQLSPALVVPPPARGQQRFRAFFLAGTAAATVVVHLGR